MIVFQITHQHIAYDRREGDHEPGVLRLERRRSALEGDANVRRDANHEGAGRCITHATNMDRCLESSREKRRSTHEFIMVSSILLQDESRCRHKTHGLCKEKCAHRRFWLASRHGSEERRTLGSTDCTGYPVAYVSVLHPLSRVIIVTSV